MALEEVTEAKLPFGMGKVDFSSPVSALLLVISLVLGFTVWNLTDSIGQNLASKVAAAIGEFLPGGNPTTSSNENSGAAFGGN